MQMQPTARGGGGGGTVTTLPDVIAGTGPDQLVLKVSGDVYANNDGTSDAAGHATFTVSIDGKQVGGTFTALGSHASGQTQKFILNGTFGTGTHSVAVTFLNDAWGGTATTDRNLYVDGVSYRGADTSQSTSLYSAGAATFSVSGGTNPGTTPTRSPEDTVITAASTQGITDAKGNVWTIKGGQVAVNGVADATTANVKELAFVKGKVWQENTANLWWAKTAPTDAWSPAAGTPTPPISLTVNSAGQSTLVDGTTAHAETDYGAAVNLTAPGVIAVTVGTSPVGLRFLNMTQVSVTGSARNANVALNSGALSLSTGKGAMNVIGGSGRDTYAYHAGSGQLTIADFSLAQGDALKIDKALQGAMTAGADGSGGTLLSFGTLAAGIDLKGVASVPTSGIAWV
jgi:hypothetical protein